MAKVTERRESAIQIRSRTMQGAKLFGEVRLNEKAGDQLSCFLLTKLKITEEITCLQVIAVWLEHANIYNSQEQVSRLVFFSPRCIAYIFN